MADESCPKYWIKCFHCGQVGHHSAVCHLPDVAQKIEEQIEESAAELRQTMEKVDAIRRKLSMEAKKIILPPNPILRAGVSQKCDLLT